MRSILSSCFLRPLAIFDFRPAMFFLIKVLNGWHFHKVGRKSPAGQVKVLQILPDFPCSMVVKPQKVTVLLISSPEGGVFFFESLPEIRVTQLPGQTAGLLRESIAFDF